MENLFQFLCIIHDKMDHTKTAIPRMQRIMKATLKLGQIPISLIGMLKYGHDNGAYADYSAALWPVGSNFTILSLCHVLRALKRAAVKQPKELFRAPPQNSFFDTLLHRKSRCSSSIWNSEGCNDIPSSSWGRPAGPLLKRLYLQLDNSTKDNKNKFVMAFCSLFTARDIFKDVTVGFLIVKHIHKDIDAYFSYLSKLLK